MSTTAFNNVKKSINLTGINLSAFNEPISNGAFMEVGRHEVTVESTEVKDNGYGDNLIVVWKREDGASIKQFIPLAYEDRNTKEKSISKGYIAFTRLFINDMAFRSSFFLEAALQDTGKFNALVGLKGAIVVGKGKKGYEIVSEPVSGGYVVVDVATSEKLIDTVFMSMGDANTEAKNQGLTRAYNNVVAVQPLIAEVENNEQALRSALTANTAAPSAKTLQSVNML